MCEEELVLSTHVSENKPGLQMYLDALEKASWSLFPRGRLEEDLAKGDDFKSDNQECSMQPSLSRFQVWLIWTIIY